MEVFQFSFFQASVSCVFYFFNNAQKNIMGLCNPSGRPEGSTQPHNGCSLRIAFVLTTNCTLSYMCSEHPRHLLMLFHQSCQEVGRAGVIGLFCYFDVLAKNADNGFVISQ